MTFAVLGFNPDRVAAMVVNALAVGGGFLAGFVLAGVAAHFLDKWLAAGRSPAGLHKALRYLGGICGAILVILLVFRAGGGGPGDGPGTTAATGVGSGPGAGPTTAVTAPTPDPTAKDKPPEPARTEEVVRVTVLSGADVVDGKFYLIDIATEKRTLDEVKRELAARKAVTLKALAVEVVLATRTDPDGSGVRSLIAAAQDAGYAVKLPQAR